MIPQTPNIIKSPLCYAGDTRTIPQTTPAGTNQLSYESGFPLLTSTPIQAGGIPPDRLDFNAALNLLSTFIYYMQSGNQFVWSNQLDYNTGAFVIGSDNAVYFCIQANGATEPNTVQDPTSSTGYWVKVIDAQGVFNINIIADGTVSTAKLANSAVTNEKITNMTITGAKLVNKTITSTQIADNTITAAQLAANSVGASELADNAVDTNAIVNLSVTNAKIANAAVNDAKILGVSASKVTGLARVATSGSYNDLTNKPTIPTNFPPKPISGTGTALGVWRHDFGSGTSYTLPAGGTWAWIAFPFDSSSYLPAWVLVNSGVNSGGSTVVTTTGATVSFMVFIWRIQ